MTKTFISPSADESYLDTKKATSVLTWIFENPKVYNRLLDHYTKYGPALMAYLLENGGHNKLDGINKDFLRSFGGTGTSWGSVLEEFAHQLESMGELVMPNGLDGPFVYGGDVLRDLDELWQVAEDEWTALRTPDLWVIIRRSYFD